MEARVRQKRIDYDKWLVRRSLNDPRPAGAEAVACNYGSYAGGGIAATCIRTTLPRRRQAAPAPAGGK